MDENEKTLVEDTSLDGQIRFVEALLQTLERGEFSMVIDDDPLIGQVRAIYDSLQELKKKEEA